MILAQLEHVPASTIKDVLLILIALAGVWTLVRPRKDKREIAPQPLQIEHTEPCAKKSELDRHVSETNKRIGEIQEELKQDRHENQVHASERSKTIFNQIEKVRVELDEKVEDTRKELTEKIDDLPDRVITTLKNTGAI